MIILLVVLKHLIMYVSVIPFSTTLAYTRTTREPCLITDGIADMSIIPDKNIFNSNGVSVGDRIRLIESSLGYSPSSVNDTVTVRLAQDPSPIAIDQILINAQNFVSAIVSIKKTKDDAWQQFATLTRTKTIFYNLSATDLQLKFSANTKYVKMGIIGCFLSAGNKVNPFLKIREYRR
jgi:hypothetical protein